MRNSPRRHCATALVTAAALLLVSASAVANGHRHKSSVHARVAKKAPQTPVFAAAHYKVERVIGPSPLHGIQGLAVAPDGGLYAGSLIGRSISRIDRATGAVSSFGPSRGSVGDMAIAADG